MTPEEVVMSTKTAVCLRPWDFAAAESIDKSQRWVLCAMQGHGQGLVTMLWRILGNEQDVCDAYQQTFLQLAHYQNAQKPDNIKAYLYRTAANVAISMLRHARIHRQATKLIARSARAGCDADCDNQLDSKLMQKKLRTAITRLPEYLRNVIILHDLAELSYSQVEKVLDIRAATARVYRCKAITLLAEWLADDRKSR